MITEQYYRWPDNFASMNAGGDSKILLFVLILLRGGLIAGVCAEIVVEMLGRLRGVLLGRLPSAPRPTHVLLLLRSLLEVLTGEIVQIVGPLCLALVCASSDSLHGSDRSIGSRLRLEVIAEVSIERVLRLILSRPCPTGPVHVETSSSSQELSRRLLLLLLMLLLLLNLLMMLLLLWLCLLLCLLLCLRLRCRSENSHISTSA